MVHVYAVIGDSNVRRHMTALSCRASPSMSNAQIKTCGKLEAFAETLRSVRSDVTVCIVAVVTNFLTSAEGSTTTVGLKVAPVLQEFREVLLDFCQEMPERLVYLCVLVSLISHVRMLS